MLTHMECLLEHMPGRTEVRAVRLPLLLSTLRFVAGSLGDTQACCGWAGWPVDSRTHMSLGPSPQRWVAGICQPAWPLCMSWRSTQVLMLVAGTLPIEPSAWPHLHLFHSALLSLSLCGQPSQVPSFLSAFPGCFSLLSREQSWIMLCVQPLCVF